MLCKLSEKQDLLSKSLFQLTIIFIDEDEQSILQRFVYLSKYFNPNFQIDKKSVYSVKTVEAEKVFIEILSNFNPESIH